MIRLKALVEQTPGSSPCNMWSRKGVEHWNGEDGRPKITINATDSKLILKYVGSGYGHAISTVNAEGDSLHQAWNVVSCETNNYIKKGGLKPVIANISATCTKDKNVYDLTIEIPFESVDASLVYQINRRGGWGHKGNTATLPKKGPNFEGPVTHVTKTGGGDITEHWVIYTIAGSKKSNSVTPAKDKQETKPKKKTDTVKPISKKKYKTLTIDQIN